LCHSDSFHYHSRACGVGFCGGQRSGRKHLGDFYDRRFDPDCHGDGTLYLCLEKRIASGGSYSHDLWRDRPFRGGGFRKMGS